MAAAFVQYQIKSNGAGQTSIASNSITLTAGNLVIILILIGNGSSQAGSSVTDTLGNTYHRLATSHTFQAALFGGSSVEIWYAFNVAGGATIITASGWANTGGFNNLEIAEYSASPTWGVTDPIDTSGSGAAASGTPSVGLTLAQANELVVGGIYLSAATGWVWTNAVDRTGIGGGTMDGANGSFGDHQAGSSGGYSVTGTGGSSTAYAGSAAAFKVPASTLKRPTVCIME